MRFDPKDIVEHLRHNLERYPYGDGFTVFRELLQNADDAKSKRVVLKIFDGWAEAKNPLLQGPGVLLINDGEFDARSSEGMQTFGGSVKATDQEAVGRFGLGQKSVFHICDAFIVVPSGYDDQCYPFVVNPFETLGQPGDACLEWKNFIFSDADYVKRAGIQEGFTENHLSLWFPLRRAGLRPKPKSSGIEASDICVEHLRPLADQWRMAEILASLRHIQRIEIYIAGTSVIVDREQAPRMTGYSLEPGIRPFGGNLGSGIVSVGRERMAPADFRVDLRQSNSWPRTRNRLTDEEEPQKASPHGAVLLLVDEKSRGGLSADWSVLLPVASAFSELSALSGERVKLLLHGCFFVDSGRKAIAGFGQDPEEISAQAQVRVSWNEALRANVVLPLVPAVMHDALSKQFISSESLAAIVSEVAQSDFGLRHRAEIANENALARVVEQGKSGYRAVWRLVPSSAKLCPLPAADERGRVALADLVPELGDWAAERGITLFCGSRAVLSAEPPRWLPEDLKDLLCGVQPTVFTSKPRTEALAQFLSAAVDNNEELKEAVAPPLLAILRKALATDRPLAPHESISRVLAQIDCSDVMALPQSASERYVLRALASAAGGPVCLPDVWLFDAVSPSNMPAEEGLPLILALQPLLQSEKQADAAGAAATAVVRNLSDLSSVLDHPQMRNLPVLRALDGRASRPISLADLDDAGSKRLLFRDNPSARKRLRLLSEALPDSVAYIVPSAVADVLADQFNRFPLSDLTNEAASRVVEAADSFGPVGSRAELLEDIFTENPAALGALRRLAACDSRASAGHVNLVALEHTVPALDALVLRLIAESPNELLVPAMIMDRLDRRKLTHLGVKTLDETELGSLLVRHADALSGAGLDEAMASDILAYDLSDSDLLELAIFRDTQGNWHKPSSIWRNNPAWPVPRGLQEIVGLLAPIGERKAKARAERLVSEWTPNAQTDFCLNQSDPAEFSVEILKALEMAAPSDLTALREKPWLQDNAGQKWSPMDVLDLDEDIMTALSEVPWSSETSPFLPITKLAPELRRDEAMKVLRKKDVLGDADEMEAELLRRIAKLRPVAIFGPGRKMPSHAIAELAKTGISLGLPGWPLLAALLRQSNEDPSRILNAFGVIRSEQRDYAVRALGALAQLAENGNKDAWATYKWAFGEVANWSAQARSAVLSIAPVRTREGGWRPGGEVASQGGGVAPSRLLDEQLCSAFPAIRSGVGADKNRHDPIDPSRPAQADVKAFTKEVVAGLKVIVEYSKPHVPSDLLLLLLGLIGRSDEFSEIAVNILEAREVDRKRIWRRLDDEVAANFQSSSHDGSLQTRREETFLILSPVSEPPKTVEVETLSGEMRALPFSDLAPLRVLGNLHAGGFTYFVGQKPIRRKPLQIGTPTGGAVNSRDVRELCLSIAEVVIGHRSEQPNALEALDALIDACDRTDQTLLESVRAELEDQLPHILGELKPAKGTRLRDARDAYKEAIDATPPGEARNRARPKAKSELWSASEESCAREELLAAVRNRIEDYGYDATRVLFELFQNADDAAVQNPPAGEARFFVEPDKARIRVLHWGRLLNHHGPSPEVGAREGWAGDLLNMLLLNVSDKTEDVTGRFGLGFKSVHLIAKEVGIASRFVACRIHGGMLPSPWPEGREISEAKKRGGRAATVIDLELDSGQDSENLATSTVEAFKKVAHWLPAMSRGIECVEIAGEVPRRVVRKTTEVPGIEVADFSGPRTQTAIVLDLGEETTLFLPLDSVGPVPAAAETPRLWLMAPLEETLKTGWLMNRMGFRVDPGRGRLAGSEAERFELFRNLGSKLGATLVALFDHATNDWTELATMIRFDTQEQANGADRFLEKLFELFALDVQDPLAEKMHGPTRGLGHLITERSALPTGLPQPFARLLKAEEAEYELKGVLSDRKVLLELRDWSAAAEIFRRSVGPRAAELLEKLGFKRPRPFGLCELIRREIGQQRQVGPDVAARIGNVLTGSRVESLDVEERQALLALFRDMTFLMADNNWRTVGLPSHQSKHLDEEGRRILEFAPESEVAAPNYFGPADDLYNIAIQQSGYQRTARKFATWAKSMAENKRRSALLRYVIEGRQGVELAKELSNHRPGWLPASPQDLKGSELVAAWSKDDLAMLLSFIYPDENRRHWDDLGIAPVLPPIDPKEFLEQAFAWWRDVHIDERREYDRIALPTDFDPGLLRDKDAEADREGWFTFFALGAFRTIGFGHEAAHAKFIDRARRSGWWPEMAETKLPDNPQPWIDRLEDFARTDVIHIDFPQWRRMIADLYMIARWLPDYAEAFRSLPFAVKRAHKGIQLSDALKPSASPIWQRHGLEGAPASQSLGIGANWMIREAIRHGFWAETEAIIMQPYAWASTRRLRTLFEERLGESIGERADMDVAPYAYKTVSEHLGERAGFLGDIDLPLQILALRGVEFGHSNPMGIVRVYDAAAKCDEAEDE